MKKYAIFIVIAVAIFGIAYVSWSGVFSSKFSVKTYGLIEAKESEIVELKDGDVYELVAGPVKKFVNGKEVRMIAYNGMIPGPTIKVKQGGEITINLKNETDVGTALHSHGVRLDNAFDGVPGLTQNEIKPGETFTYKIKFPDAGIFWYHPHVREDYTQPLGLYGNYLVTSIDPDYLSQVNKEEIITIGDILMDENGIAPYSKSNVDYALMGRFGNVMLVNGKTDYSLSANAGDVVRFYFTNVASTRPFNISLPGAKMKLVAADQGKYEREVFVDSVILSPSERAVVDVHFPSAGTYEIKSVNPIQTRILGSINVSASRSAESFVTNFNTLRTNSDVVEDINTFRQYFSKAPDKRLRLSINMGHGSSGMHQMPDGSMMSNSGMSMGSSHTDGIEWEDTMMEMNKSMDATTEWQVIDEDTGKRNMDVMWEFSRGDKVKIEITNDPNAMHPMQHPIHFHGQRFLVLTRDGVPETNLVWKDTVLIPAGERIEILLDASNPGSWMAHCHIAEHLEAGMMFGFNVK
ncbi:MAG: multicopper oxidase family protein [Candidatus Paceibacterota bacterium]|jgi:FtsP/CotA-like multicopper oxidase with cupredoxin domain